MKDAMNKMARDLAEHHAPATHEAKGFKFKAPKMSAPKAPPKVTTPPSRTPSGGHSESTTGAVADVVDKALNSGPGHMFSVKRNVMRILRSGNSPPKEDQNERGEKSNVIIPPKDADPRYRKKD